MDRIERSIREEERENSKIRVEQKGEGESKEEEGTRPGRQKGK